MMRSAKARISVAVWLWPLVLAVALFLALVVVLPGHAAALLVTGQVARVVVEYDDGSTQVFVPEAEVVTATATRTPSPTATYTPTSTQTPSPTVTATPSATPTVTPTAVVEPTQENDPVLTMTIEPTPFYSKSCSLTATDYIKEREAASLDGNPASTWYPGYDYEFFKFVQADGYLWGLHENEAGLQLWSAVYSYAAAEWWVAAGRGIEDCVEINGWDTSLPLPEAVAFEPCWGWHVIVGSNGDALLPGQCIIKGTDDTWNLLPIFFANNPDGFSVCRTLFVGTTQADGPTGWLYYNPYTYYHMIFPNMPDDCDYYEIMNEWGPPLDQDGNEDWAAWSDFTIGMVDVANVYGKNLLVGSHSTGNPPVEAWPYVGEVLNYIEGTGHGLAVHLTGMMPDDVDVPDNSWVANEYITLHIKNMCDYLAEKGITDCKKGRLIATEFGYWGYDALGIKYDPGCEDIAKGVAYSLAQYKKWGYISAAAYFTLSGGVAWQDFGDCQPHIAAAVAAG